MRSSTPLLILWWLVLFSASCCSSGIAVLAKPTTQLNKRWKAITQLRTVGRSNLKAHQYQQASYCYAAVLQMVEGTSEPRYMNVRRRCGVLLGRCEELLGHEHQAIARCSEVINEAPDVEPTYETGTIYASKDIDDDLTNHDETSRNIGEAYYCRARCLRKINEPQLALVDLQEALKYLPDESGIYQEIAQIEQERLQATQPPPPPPQPQGTPETLETTETPPPLLEPTTPIDSAPQNANVSIASAGNVGNESEHRVDFLEYCLLNYPSAVFTKKQVRTLCSLARRLDTLALRPNNYNTGTGTTAVSASPGAGVGNMQDLLSSLTSGVSGGVGPGRSNSGGAASAGAASADNSGALGGMSNLLNLLTPGNQGRGKGQGGLKAAMNIESLISLLPLLSSFTGLSADATENVAEILRALSRAYTVLSKLWQKVSKHRELIVIALSVLWVVVTAVSALYSLPVR